jgi:HK97 family phage portal protein
VGALHDLIYGPEAGPVVRALPYPVPALPAPLAAPEPGHGLPVSLGSLIEAAVAARVTGWTMGDAIRMPSVIRGVQVICSTLASMSVVAYRDEAMLEAQPRVLRRPSPFLSRYDFVYQTCYALLAGDDDCAQPGNAWWLITDRDAEELPRAVVQLPNGEVRVEWDGKHFRPVTTWRGHLVPERDLIHIALGRPVGGLLGRSPLEQGLDALGIAATAEAFASSWFLTSGVPSVVLKVAGAMTEDEANRLKMQWMAAHGVEPTPAVLSGGIDLDIPDIDPQRSQMQEARDYGNTVVSRLLGIPAPLLHVSTSGATITYVGAAGAIEELVKATLAPTYMPPLEFAFGELVPATQSARFNARELLRVDIGARFGVYREAIDMGVLDAGDVRAIEGWPRTGPVFGQTFAPQPAAPAAPSPQEVPDAV